MRLLRRGIPPVKSRELRWSGSSPAIASIIALALLSFSLACAKKTSAPPAELAKASRVDTNGWINVHLEGTPREIGFQHGWLLAPEIDDLLKALAHFLEGSTKRDWAFFRGAAERMFWPKLEAEYQEEIEGIVAGPSGPAPPLRRTTAIDITVLNGWIELAWYYVPYLDEHGQEGRRRQQGPGYCSAFIATGSWTEGGGIVIGHNNWVDYIIGSRWNVIADIVPATGHRILMDGMPGAIHSGDDFVMNGAGLVYTETTMGTFKGFREEGTPEFARARKAAQYAASIDDFVRIMSADNNGAYANDWLVGDTKTGEIAKFELGLKNQRLWRTTDGYFVGSNFPGDEKVIAEETTFNAGRQGAVRAREESALGAADGGVQGLHRRRGRRSSSRPTTSTWPRGRRDPTATCSAATSTRIRKARPSSAGRPSPPPDRSRAKSTSSALVKEMKMWAHMGHPCGRDFIAADFLAKHPEFAWQKPYLKDLKASPWTLFEAKK